MQIFSEQFRKLRFSSKLFLLLGVIFFLPLLMLIPYKETEYAMGFVIPSMLTIATGILVEFKYRYSAKPKHKNRQYHIVIMVAIWIFAFIMGGFPFYFCEHLDILRSIFQSASAWTGTSILMLDVGRIPYIFLFYHSLMQFLGGLGFVLLMLIFSSGTEAMELLSAEGNIDKLEPNLIGTARFMMAMYFGFAAIGMILYIICGMSWFDAINYSMTAIATGGFSTHEEGIFFYNSVPIEVITIILMLFGSTNFSILALLIKGQFKKLSKIGELRFLLGLLLIFIPLITFFGTKSVYKSYGQSIRMSIFQTISFLTSSGFALTNFDDWHPTMRLCLILIMLIGGGASSTAGGIKYSRVYVAFKSFIMRLKEKFLPERVVQKMTIYDANGKVTITSEHLLQIHHFILIYLSTFLIGSLLLTVDGISVEHAIFEFASTLGTMGLSTGITTVSSSNYVLIIHILGMLLARLEIYAVYIFFAAGVKKVAKVITRN